MLLEIEAAHLSPKAQAPVYLPIGSGQGHAGTTQERLRLG